MRFLSTSTSSILTVTSCPTFTTVVGWYYFGETNVKYLFGDKGLLPYRAIVIIFIIMGSMFTDIGLVWSIADMTNSIMVLPNLIGLLVLMKYWFVLINLLVFHIFL